MHRVVIYYIVLYNYNLKIYDLGWRVHRFNNYMYNSVSSGNYVGMHKAIKGSSFPSNCTRIAQFTGKR